MTAYTDRKTETKAVKAALKRAGIPNARVRHCTGTAWGWLRVIVPQSLIDNPPEGIQRNLFAVNQRQDTWGEVYRHIIRIVQEATGRSGDYDGCINVGFREM